jgi:hypothetical protein
VGRTSKSARSNVPPQRAGKMGLATVHRDLTRTSEKTAEY